MNKLKFKGIKSIPIYLGGTFVLFYLGLRYEDNWEQWKHKRLKHRIDYNKSFNLLKTKNFFNSHFPFSKFKNKNMISSFISKFSKNKIHKISNNDIHGTNSYPIHKNSFFPLHKITNTTIFNPFFSKFSKSYIPSKELLNYITSNNQFKLYFTGSSAFQDMWKDIDESKHTVELVTYTYNNDNVGIQTSNHLIAAAKRGVKVTLILDRFGSSDLFFNTSISPLLKKLDDEGVKVIVYNPYFKDIVNKLTSLKILSHYHPFHRCHAKILVLDNRIGYLGGMNVADGYAEHEVGGNGGYYDNQIRISGPAVSHIRNSVERIINNTERNYTLEKVKNTTENNKISNNLTNTLILTTKLGNNYSKLKQYLRNSLLKSEEYIYITNPLITMPYTYIKCLRKSSKRGVKVIIITSGYSNDVIFSLGAHRYLYKKLLEKGIRIFEYSSEKNRSKSKMLHAKTVIIDGKIFYIGSSNLDRYSLKNNIEIMAYITNNNKNEKIISEMEKRFISDLKYCNEVTISDYSSRSIFQKISYVI